jgi:hypothetical protein
METLESTLQHIKGTNTLETQFMVDVDEECELLKGARFCSLEVEGHFFLNRRA